ncbi:hypothetical protein SAMN06295987_1231, partial [Novosphingobium mathurense]
MNCKKFGAVALAILSSGVSVVAFAQVTGADAPQDSGDASQEIIVTATRQEQVLRRVPLSVTAYSQEALD